MVGRMKALAGILTVILSVSGAYAIEMVLVLERDSISQFMPVCGYVEIRNPAPNDTILVDRHEASLSSGVFTVVDPLGEKILVSDSTLNRYAAPGEERLKLTAGGGIRLPFFLLRHRGVFVFEDVGSYEILYQIPDLDLSAEAYVRVCNPRSSDEKYRKSFEDYDSIKGVFWIGPLYLDKWIALRDELEQDSEYVDALDMLIDYNEGYKDVKLVLVRSANWNTRSRSPKFEELLNRGRKFNLELWAYVRETVARGECAPVDGWVYIDRFQHY